MVPLRHRRLVDLVADGLGDSGRLLASSFGTPDRVLASAALPVVPARGTRRSDRVGTASGDQPFRARTVLMPVLLRPSRQYGDCAIAVDDRRRGCCALRADSLRRLPAQRTDQGLPTPLGNGVASRRATGPPSQRGCRSSHACNDAVVHVAMPVPRKSLSLVQIPADNAIAQATTSQSSGSRNERERASPSSAE